MSRLLRKGTCRRSITATALTVGVAALAVSVATARAAAGPLRLVETFQRYSGEEGLAVGFGSVWTGAADTGDSIARTDVATGQSRSLPAPVDGDDALYVGEGAVWQTDFGHGIVRRVDPTTNKVTARSGFAGPAGMAFLGRRVFVALHHAQSVVEVSPRTLKVVHTYRLPAPGGGVTANGPSDLAVAGHSLWVSVPNLGATYRLDLRTGATEARLAGCGGFASVADALWAICDGHLARIDLATNHVRPTAATGQFIATLGSTLWIAGTRSITEVSAPSGRVRARQTLPGAFIQDLVGADGHLWAFDANSVRVLEFAP